MIPATPNALTRALAAGLFSPIIHTHAAAEITSGLLDNARVNWGAPGAIGAVTPNTIAGSSLSIAPDTDASTILGRARIDSRGTDVLYISHYDMSAANSYALYQSAAGRTRVNAPTGQQIDLTIQSAAIATIDSTGLTVLPDADALTRLGRARIDSRGADQAYFSHYDHSTTVNYALRQDNAGITIVNAAASQIIGFRIGNSPKGNYSTTGLRVGDEAAASTTLHAVTADAVTNVITNVLTLGHNSSGTPAASFGTGLLFQGESSTTENRDMGRIRTLWTTATDASRVANMVLSVFNIGAEVNALEISPTHIITPATYLGFTGQGVVYGTSVLYLRCVSGTVNIQDAYAGNVNIVAGGGKVAIGATITPTALLDINGDTLRLRTAKTPASAGASGNVGDHCWDADYLYICTATNTWRRVAHATW